MTKLGEYPVPDSKPRFDPLRSQDELDAMDRKEFPWCRLCVTTAAVAVVAIISITLV